ncbi:hypothetical protein Hypma_003383 [Hypsizygus marmoreus]|uniref:Uncharacterized protein n=1 Tax=Hypsizygus marmoreus TaxID=39966 RepID=A0A369J8P5_HYPMA|nr:hypothetical protein Hypma_003383 [Hypsizygus marmoreus]
MRLPRPENRLGLPVIGPQIYRYGMPVSVKPAQNAPREPGVFVHYDYKMMRDDARGRMIPGSQKKWIWKCIGAIVSIRRRPTKKGYMRGQWRAVPLSYVF